jgi:hypothetical protein
LLACERSASASLEHIEDVAVHRANGEIVFERMKSALTGNPLSDWAPDLWKTIAYWMRAIAADEIDVTQSQFRYYVTPIKAGVFAQALSDAVTPAATAAVTSGIMQALRKKQSRPPQCLPELQVFLKCNRRTEGRGCYPTKDYQH